MDTNRDFVSDRRGAADAVMGTSELAKEDFLRAAIDRPISPKIQLLRCISACTIC